MSITIYSVMVDKEIVQIFKRSTRRHKPARTNLNSGYVSGLLMVHCIKAFIINKIGDPRCSYPK